MKKKTTKKTTKKDSLLSQVAMYKMAVDRHRKILMAALRASETELQHIRKAFGVRKTKKK